MKFPGGLGSAIAYKDNVLSDDLCIRLIDYAEEHQDMMYQGPTMGGLNTMIKNCFDFCFGPQNKNAETEEQRNELAEFNSEIFKAFSPALEEYCLFFSGLSEWKNRYDTGYQFQKYLMGEGFYTPHCDGGPYHYDGSGDRVIAAVMYLNTVERGGGTNFPIHDITVQAVRGRVSLFPTNFTHPHSGVMPLSSDKYIISTFCYTIPDKPDESSTIEELEKAYNNEFTEQH